MSTVHMCDDPACRFCFPPEKLGPLGPTGDAGEKEARCAVCGREEARDYWHKGDNLCRVARERRNPHTMPSTVESMANECKAIAYERLLSERKGLRAEAFEEAAQAVEAQRCHSDFSLKHADGGEQMAAKIRALAATSAPQDNPKVTK